MDGCPTPRNGHARRSRKLSSSFGIVCGERVKKPDRMQLPLCLSLCVCAHGMFIYQPIGMCFGGVIDAHCCLGEGVEKMDGYDGRRLHTNILNLRLIGV